MKRPTPPVVFVKVKRPIAEAFRTAQGIITTSWTPTISASSAAGRRCGGRVESAPASHTIGRKHATERVRARAPMTAPIAAARAHPRAPFVQSMAHSSRKRRDRGEKRFSEPISSVISRDRGKNAIHAAVKRLAASPQRRRLKAAPTATERSARAVFTSLHTRSASATGASRSQKDRIRGYRGGCKVLGRFRAVSYRPVVARDCAE